MNKIWCSLIALLAFCAPAIGQSFIQNTMYDYNRLVYNPATAGLGSQGTNLGWSLNALGRLQWAGIDGSPQLASLSAHRYFENFGSIGGYIMQDELGPLSSTSINLSYALPIQVGNGHLSFGVSGGYSQRAINLQIFSIQPDPILLDPGNFLTNSIGAFNLAAGVFYQAKKDGYENFFIGFSGQDLLEPSLEQLTINPGNGSLSNVPRSFYLTSGYKIPLGIWTKNSYNYLQPTIMLRNQSGVFQSDISLYTKVSALRAGINYRGVAFTGQDRGSESFGAILGFDVSDEMFFGYSYDINLSSLNANGDASSHEIVLTYKFPSPGAKATLQGNPIKTSTNVPEFQSPTVGSPVSGPKAEMAPDSGGKKGKKVKAPKVKKEKKVKEGKEGKEKSSAKDDLDKEAKKAAKEAEKAKKKDEKAKKKAKKQYKAKKKKTKK